MRTTKTRNALAAAAVAAAVSLAGSTGVASAAKSTAMSGTHMSQTTLNHQIATASALTAGATGDGPATQADCDRYAHNINSWGSYADTAGTYDEAMNAADNAAALEDEAMDNGCFIVYG